MIIKVIILILIIFIVIIIIIIISVSVYEVIIYPTSTPQVTRKLEMSVEIQELNALGTYEPVEVQVKPDIYCGGVFQLRQVCDSCTRIPG